MDINPLRGKLGKDFALEKYGLQVRFVNEDDAEYIVNLRTNGKLGRFLSVIQNDVEAQKQWIRAYKTREEQGLEYYFYYSQNGTPVGVNRIYNIKNKTATAGSWICTPDLPIELPFLTLVIIREIFFETLQLETDIFDIRKANKKIIRMHNMMGAHFMYENDIDVFHYMTNEDFKKNKAKFLGYLGITI